jgi:hypothetical protein
MRIYGHNAMAPAKGSALQICLADATWGSTITLSGGFAPSLPGHLVLSVAPGVDPVD